MQMVDLFLLFFAGFAIGISGAMTPEPLTFYTVSEVVTTNKLAGFRIIFGHMLLEFLIILAVLCGLKQLLLATVLTARGRLRGHK